MFDHTQRTSKLISSPVLSTSSATLFQGILNASPACVAYCEPVARASADVPAAKPTILVYRVVNARMSALIGQPISAIVDQPLPELTPWLTTADLIDQYISVLETGQSASHELLFHAHQQQRWYLVMTEPLSSGLVISLIDITDRKQAELQARQQADELRATLDASLNSILLMRAIRDNTTGQIVDFRMETANQAVINSLFKTPDELQGRTLLDVFPGNVESGFFALYARVADTGQSEKAEYYYQDANGFKGWFEVSAVQQATDAIVLTFNNVTNLREEQLAQQKQAQVLEAILDHSQTAISLHEPIRNEQGTVVDFQTIRANRQALLDWELTAEEALARSLLNVRPQARGEEFDRYVRVLETGEPAVVELTQNRRQYVVTIACAGGNIVMSSVDVTTDRQYRLELETLNRTLQQSNESLQSFAYVASHDLQEPLRKIQAFGDILQNQFQDNLSDGERDMTRRIQKSANRMQQLVKDLLAYSQVTARREPHVPVSLDEVVSDVISDLEITITEANATIQVSPLPTVPGNVSRLRQLMQNLIVNALKFRSRDRPLVIQIDCQPAPPDKLPKGLPDSSAYWLIRVADNGMGFDEKYKDRIFQLFQRLHDSSSYSGTGIGLAICQRVVESHDGAIDVSSRLGEGTTFCIYLPVQQTEN